MPGSSHLINRNNYCHIKLEIALASEIVTEEENGITSEDGSQRSLDPIF